MEYRTEHDSMGEVKVDADRFWGAQTQRCLENFRVGTEKLPPQTIKAIVTVKKACALANKSLGEISTEKADLIVGACDEILAGKYDSEFPLPVWQAGSGTPSNMNVNEVIANIVNLGRNENILHPNDDVNRGQSTNDVFPSAMHIAALKAVNEELIPAVTRLKEIFEALSVKYMNVIKVGRTHMQDAVPLSFGQEISAFAKMLDNSLAMIKVSSEGLRSIALGGTAVGTGLNAHPDFAQRVVEELNAITGGNFVSSENKFHALSSKDELAFAHSAIKVLAVDLLKIMTDIKLLSSGPRAGIGEMIIPENEPGSSIMPGKVNPMQCESVLMVCVQVIANDTSISIGASQGNWQLNTYVPLIIYNFLQSVGLLADTLNAFCEHCAYGIEPNVERIKENLEKSLMTVTALNPIIGYDNSAKIAKLAHSKNMTLKQAALELGVLSEAQFDEAMDYEKMVFKKKGV